MTRQDEHARVEDARVEDAKVPSVVADDPDALRTDIRRAREGLAETVEALARKLDVRARAMEQAQQAREELKTRADTAREIGARVAATAKTEVSRDLSWHRGLGTAAIAAGAAALLAALLWARRRRPFSVTGRSTRFTGRRATWSRPGRALG